MYQPEIEILVEHLESEVDHIRADIDILENKLGMETDEPSMSINIEDNKPKGGEVS